MSDVNGISRVAWRTVAGLLACVLAACAQTDPTYLVGEQSAKHLSRVEAERAMMVSAPAAAAHLGLDEPLKILSAPQPAYPAELRNAGITGTVRVRFLVQEDGTVSNVTAVGSPQPDLAALAVQTVLQWRFEPLKRKEQPLKTWMGQDFTFRLD